MNIELNDDEVLIIKDYFKNKHNTHEIRKMDFVDLMNTKFTRNFDPEEAKSSLTTLKQKLISLGQTSSQLLGAFDPENTGRLPLRNFKIAINTLKALN